MKIPFKIGDKEFYLSQYKTSQEKDILILLSFDIFDYDSVFDILNFKTDFILSTDEKKVILYKFREISVGDEVNVAFTCECGQANENTLDASNFVQTPKRNDSDIKKMNILVTDDNLHQFIRDSNSDLNVDDLDIEEFEELKERVKDNQLKFEFIKSSKCLKCGKERNFDLCDIKYILEIMSDDSLMSLYQTYNYLNFFGKYTKSDVDDMLPFERSIFSGLVNKAREDLNS